MPTAAPSVRLSWRASFASSSSSIARMCLFACVVFTLSRNILNSGVGGVGGGGGWGRGDNMADPVDLLRIEQEFLDSSSSISSGGIIIYEYNITYGSPRKPRSLGNNISILSLAPRRFRSNAIVLLVQKQHSSYQHRDSYGLLLQSLDLLRDNYLLQNYHHHHHHDGHTNNTNNNNNTNTNNHNNNLNNVDIFLFHTGDFDMTDLAVLETRLLSSSGQEGARSKKNKNNNNNNNVIDEHRGIFKLVNLQDTPYWSLPHNLRHDNPTKWNVANSFSIGYRHMCRFFAITIWDFFQTVNKHQLVEQQQQQQQQEQQHMQDQQEQLHAPAVGYEYIFRLDEDSFILSPIPYNLFDFMKEHEYVYGFRMCSYELNHHGVRHWWERWHSGLMKNKNKNGGNNNNNNNNNNTKRGRYPISWDLCGVYNNFFIASVSFFQSKRVQAFLKNEIDLRGFIYRHRYGDLLVHSLAIYAFAEPAHIHRFLDFTYQHMTVLVDHDDNNNNSSTSTSIADTKCPLVWGALQAGYMDPHAASTMERFYFHYHVYDRCIAACRRRRRADDNNDNKNNSNSKKKNATNMALLPPPCPIQLHSLTMEDLSPSYSHLTPKYHNISLWTIAAGQVELKGRGILSG